jgi:hypothetical protein
MRSSPLKPWRAEVDRVSTPTKGSGAPAPSGWSARGIVWLLLVVGAFLMGLLVDKLVNPSSPRAKKSAPLTERLGGAAGRRAAAAAAAAAAADAAVAAAEAAAAAGSADDAADDAAARADDAAEEEEEEGEEGEEEEGAAAGADAAPGPAASVDALWAAAAAAAPPPPADAPPLQRDAAAAAPAAEHRISDGAPPEKPTGEIQSITYADGTAVKVYRHSHYECVLCVARRAGARVLRAPSGPPSARAVAHLPPAAGGRPCRAAGRPTRCARSNFSCSSRRSKRARPSKSTLAAGSAPPCSSPPPTPTRCTPWSPTRAPFARRTTTCR